MGLNFTGERLILGKSPKRLEDESVERYKFAAQFVNGKTVLDIACGSGYGSKKLLEAGALDVDGVDVAADAVEYAQAHYGEPRLSFSVGDVASFTSDKRFDVVVCFETIEHTADYKLALQHLYQVLKPGGTLVISSPNRLISNPYAKSLSDKPLNKFHVQEFTIEELKAELRTQQFSVADTAIFGQRQQLYFGNRYIDALYRKLMKPALRANPIVLPVNRLSPRVMIIVGTKIGG